MKNTPEKDFWNSIKSRLQAYTENPEEESWDKIIAALPPKPARRYVRTPGLLVLVLASFIGGIVTSQYYNYISQSVFEKANHMTFDQRYISEKRKMGGDQAAKSFHRQHQTPEKEGSNILSEGAISKSHYTENETSLYHNHASDNSPSITRRLLTRNEHSTHQQEQVQNAIEDATNIFEYDEQKEVKSNSTASDQAKQEGNIAMATKSVKDSVAENENRTIERKVVEEEKKEQAVKKKRVLHPQLYVVLTPSLSFQKVTPRTDDDKVVSELVSPGIFSHERIGYALELGYQRPVTKNLEFYSGISYYHQRQKIRYNSADPSHVEILPSAQGGYAITPGSTLHTFNYSMSNMGVSAGFFYQIKSTKLMHKVGAGLQYQKGMLRGVSEQVYDNSKSTYLNYQLSYRMEYRVRTSTHIFFQPTLTHALYSKEHMNGPLTVKPYRAGIGFGVIYQF